MVKFSLNIPNHDVTFDIPEAGSQVVNVQLAPRPEQMINFNLQYPNITLIDTVPDTDYLASYILAKNT